MTNFYQAEQTLPDDSLYSDWHSLSVEVPLTTTNFVELRLVLRDKSAKGTWYVDSVNSIYVIDGNLGGGAREASLSGFRAP